MGIDQALATIIAALIGGTVPALVSVFSVTSSNKAVIRLINYRTDQLEKNTANIDIKIDEIDAEVYNVKRDLLLIEQRVENIEKNRGCAKCESQKSL